MKIELVKEQDFGDTPWYSINIDNMYIKKKEIDHLIKPKRGFHTSHRAWYHREYYRKEVSGVPTHPTHHLP